MNNNFSINRLIIKKNWPLLLLIFLAITGFLIRLKGLDKFGITAADEYYLVKSVKNILERGLPEFASGGYYIRGILYQYLAAGLILLGVNDIAALRIIPVICNILSIPAVFLIAKKVTNQWFALFAVFLFTFSVWEVEISRLARFYAPFVLIFLWYIYLLLQVLVDNKTENYKWLWLLSIIGVLVHEEGIFLIALNFLPYFLSKYKSNFAVTFLVLLAGIFITLIDFRNLGVVNHLPQDITFPNGSRSLPVYIPDLLLPLIFSNGAWLAAFIIPLTGFAAYLYYLIIKEKTGTEIKFYFLLIGLAALFNLFGLVVFILLILFFSKKIDPALLKKQGFLILAGFLIITFIYYFLYCYTNRGWAEIFFNESFSINKLGWVLFNYPNIYEKFLIAWIKPFPFLTFLLLISFAAIVYLYLKDYFTKKEMISNESIGYLVLIVLILFFFVTVIITPFKNLRYWYFIYPLFLVFMTYIVFKFSHLFRPKILRSAIPICLSIIIFVLSEDHNIKHLYYIDTTEISFRMNYSKNIAETYYYKEDYKSGAKIIKEKMSDDDLIITTVAPIEHYLPRLDYYYRSYEDPEFSIRSRNGGNLEVWTNAKLIYRENQLINLIKNSKKNIWLITYSPTRPGVPEFDLKLKNLYSDNTTYTNLDNSLDLFYIKSNY